MNSPLRRLPFRGAHLIVLLAGLTVFGFIMWSIWAELDQITRARGSVIPAGRVQVIQSADGGIISEIRVREGGTVKRGQVLVTLDEIKLTAAVDASRAKVAALKSVMARIEAELFDKPLVFPPDVLAYTEFVANQRQLYSKRRQALNAEIQALRNTLALINQEIELNRPLVESGDVALPELIRMQRSATDVEGQISNRRNKYLQDLQAEYAKTQEELVTAEQMLTQRLDSLGNTRLLAPTDGIVKNVRLTTVGGVLRPGDEMLQIVPTGEELIVEAKVSPRDIAFIRVGQTASVKFDAYDATIYGSGHGLVSFVSPDTLTEQQPDGDQETYYRVHLTVDTRDMRPHGQVKRIDLQPGMTATVEIKTGQHTVWAYLTKPIMKTMSEGMRER